MASGSCHVRRFLLFLHRSRSISFGILCLDDRGLVRASRLDTTAWSHPLYNASTPLQIFPLALAGVGAAQAPLNSGLVTTMRYIDTDLDPCDATHNFCSRDTLGKSSPSRSASPASRKRATLVRGAIVLLVGFRHPLRHPRAFRGRLAGRVCLRGGDADKYDGGPRHICAQIACSLARETPFSNKHSPGGSSDPSRSPPMRKGVTTLITRS